MNAMIGCVNPTANSGFWHAQKTRGKVRLQFSVYQLCEPDENVNRVRVLLKGVTEESQ